MSKFLKKEILKLLGETTTSMTSCSEDPRRFCQRSFASRDTVKSEKGPPYALNRSKLTSTASGIDSSPRNGPTGDFSPKSTQDFSSPKHIRVRKVCTKGGGKTSEDEAG